MADFFHPRVAKRETLSASELGRYETVVHAIEAHGASDDPLYLLRPHAIVSNCRDFARYFPGKVLYAVKANDQPVILNLLVENGIRAFDVASLSEIERVHRICPDAEFFFMNPVKYPSHIYYAYHHFGVRNFVLDADWELQKILVETRYAKDLHLFVRIAVCNEAAAFKLGEKFGVPPEEQYRLLEKAAQHAARISLCFHVGSQCNDVNAYANALQHVYQLLEQLPFKLTAIDIGGGFPANYATSDAHRLDVFLPAIRDVWTESAFDSTIQLLAEPGRALVASAYSLITKVIGRKQNQLYITDGMYGGLFEANKSFSFPVRAHSGAAERSLSTQTRAFEIWGPSCDSYDKLEVPFHLPVDITIGDFIEFGHAGAYSHVFRCNFNGFFNFAQAQVEDHAF